MVWRSYSQRTVRSGAATIWTACVCLALVALSQDAAAEQYTGRVVGISDADTITVLDDQNRQHKIRLLYIDAPERKQAFGNKARQALSRMIFNREVTIDGSKLDRYRRELATVAFQSQDVGLELIRQGYAWHFKRYARDQPPGEHALYSLGEQEAREARLGLWADPSPVAPWDWRAAQRQAR